jgi:hypothetical protein
MSEGVRLYAGTQVDHPTENRALFAGFCNVVRGHASGSGGR